MTLIPPAGETEEHLVVFASGSRRLIPLPRVEDKAGDDEHGSHRQHLRKRFRGRPFGGFLHAILPRPGHESSLPGEGLMAQMFLLGTPLDENSL